MDNFINEIINNLNQEEQLHCHNITNMKIKVYLRDELGEGNSYLWAYIKALEKHMEEEFENYEELLDHKDAQIQDLHDMSDELQINDILNQ